MVASCRDIDTPTVSCPGTVKVFSFGVVVWCAYGDRQFRVDCQLPNDPLSNQTRLDILSANGTGGSTMNIGQMKRALGEELCTWLLAGADLLETEELPEELQPLAGLVSQVEAQQKPSPAVMLAMQGEMGADLGNIRATFGGQLPTLEGADDLERLVLQRALDSYPLLLLHRAASKERWRQPWSPMWRADFEGGMCELIRNDPDLGRVFQGSSGFTDLHLKLVSNTGQGGGMQLAVFPGALFGSAAQLAALRGQASAEGFAEAALDLLKLWRTLCRDGAADVSAYVGLDGVALPPSVDTIGLPRATLHRMHAERLGHLDKSAWSTHMNDGTNAPFMAGVILEVPFQLRVRFGEEDLSGFMRSDRAYETLADASERIALAILLACGDKPVTVRRAWTTVADPTGFNLQTGWRQSRSYPRAPRLLSADEAGEIARWASLLGRTDDANVAVARRRILGAVGERPDHEDGLIDAIIALENLFGGSTELAFRISAGAAVLLAPPDERRQFMREVKDLYNKRSKLVHGQTSLAPAQAAEARDKAVLLVVQALRKLYEDRPDLLSDKNRSETLLLDAPGT